MLKALHCTLVNVTKLWKPLSPHVESSPPHSGECHQVVEASTTVCWMKVFHCSLWWMLPSCGSLYHHMLKALHCTLWWTSPSCESLYHCVLKVFHCSLWWMLPTCWSLYHHVLKALHCSLWWMLPSCGSLYHHNVEVSPTALSGERHQVVEACITTCWRLSTALSGECHQVVEACITMCWRLSMHSLVNVTYTIVVEASITVMLKALHCTL